MGLSIRIHNLGSVGRMRMQFHLVVAACSLAIGMACGTAYAQETPKYQDIDCRDSKIVAAPGLKCRATQVYADGSSEGFGGMFRRWISFGTASDGSQVHYFAFEAASPKSSIRPSATLESVVRGFSRSFQATKDFTPLAQISGGDYQRFTGPKGESCFAVRKLGDAQGRYYKWVMLAGKCVAKGMAISEADIVQFMGTASFRN
jgi:hypothetical protein